MQSPDRAKAPPDLEATPPAAAGGQPDPASLADRAELSRPPRPAREEKEEGHAVAFLATSRDICGPLGQWRGRARPTEGGGGLGFRSVTRYGGDVSGSRGCFFSLPNGCFLDKLKVGSKKMQILESFIHTQMFRRRNTHCQQCQN